MCNTLKMILGVLSKASSNRFILPKRTPGHDNTNVSPLNCMSSLSISDWQWFYITNPKDFFLSVLKNLVYNIICTYTHELELKDNVALIFTKTLHLLCAALINLFTHFVQFCPCRRGDRYGMWEFGAHGGIGGILQRELSQQLWQRCELQLAHHGWSR